MAIKTVKYTLEKPFKEAAELAFTVGTVTVGELGEHSKMRRVYEFHFDNLLGKTVSKLTREEQLELDSATMIRRNLSLRWTHIRAALRCVKMRPAGADKEAPLQEIDLAYLGWDTIDGVANIPVDLFDALDSASIVCNPRVFGEYIAEDPNERKVGVTSVS